MSLPFRILHPSETSVLYWFDFADRHEIADGGLSLTGTPVISVLQNGLGTAKITRSDVAISGTRVNFRLTDVSSAAGEEFEIRCGAKLSGTVTAELVECFELRVRNEPVSLKAMHDGERFVLYEFDFSDRHEIDDDGLTITGTPTVTVFESGVSSAKLTVSGTVVSNEGDKVQFRLTDSTASMGEEFTIKCAATLSGSPAAVLVETGTLRIMACDQPVLEIKHSAAHVLAKVLVQIGAATDPADSEAWSVFVAAEPNAPDNAITVYDTQGTDQGRRMIDGSLSGMSGVQVRVRSANHSTGWLKAQKLQDMMALEVLNQTVTIDQTNYRLNSVDKIGDVLAIGKGPTGSTHKFTINALVSLIAVE